MDSDKEAAEYEENVRAVKRTFSSVDGKKALKFLSGIFGADKPSALPGMRNEEVWLAEGMKAPFRKIEELMSEKKKPKQQKARTT